MDTQIDAQMKPLNICQTTTYAVRKQVTWVGDFIHAPLMHGVKVVVLLCGLGCTVVQAQSDSFAPIRSIHAALATCQGDDCKRLSDTLTSTLEEMLSIPGAMEGWPDQLDFMAGVASADKALRVFTWNWTHDNRTSSYGGLVASRLRENADLVFTALYDERSDDRPEENQTYRLDEWHGALYYRMVPDPVETNTYLLLGWDDADAQVTRKLIEPIQVRSRGLRFGAPVLQSPTGLRRRHILEYADAVQVSLRHQPKTKGRTGQPERIVFDHLAPQEPHLTGISAYYGPDMTFEAYVPGKREGSPWVLEQNVAAIQPLQQDRPFNDPRQRKRRRNRR